MTNEWFASSALLQREYEEVNNLVDTLTDQQIIDAIRKNGYEQAFGSFIHGPKNNPKACAYGQAALNLAPKKWSKSMKYKLATKIKIRGEWKSRFNDVVRLNDSFKAPLNIIADYLEGKIDYKTARDWNERNK